MLTSSLTAPLLQSCSHCALQGLFTLHILAPHLLTMEADLVGASGKLNFYYSKLA